MFPRKTILYVKTIRIKIKSTVIISAKFVYREEVGSHGRNMQYILEFKKIRRGVKLSITNMGNGKLLAIANRNKLRIVINGGVREVA